MQHLINIPTASIRKFDKYIWLPIAHVLRMKRDVKFNYIFFAF